MTSRELVIKTLAQEEAERLPRDMWALAHTWINRPDQIERFYKMYDVDIAAPHGMSYGKSRYSRGEPSRVGRYTDRFGVEHEVAEDGVAGEVKNPIIRTMRDLDNYRLPWEMLDEMTYGDQAQAYKETEKFVLLSSTVRPFERMQFLRGTEQLFIDMALDDPIFIKMKDMLHDFYVKELKKVSSLPLDGISFMDDWGTQQSLLISPDMWRKHFKPMYKEYCDIIHKGGKYAFFHSDGHTEAIYGDIVEIGIDAFNSQLFCMDIERIAEKYKGKITFWGELDRQRILPFGTEEEVRESVRRIKKAFLTPKRTGFIAQLSWEMLTPFENVVAAYDEFD
ncbi:MAG: methyltransferase [Treponema sp.]|jgi:hypothetical protein|nr:methyltransferase [Treponema sp.]